MKTLAETLGVIDPRRPDAPVPKAKKLTAKAFSEEILNSDEYRSALLCRILMHTLPPQIESLLYHYAYGKPVEHVEVKDVTDPLEEFSAEQCEKRALQLLEVARQLRAQESLSNDDDEEATDRTAVH